MKRILVIRHGAFGDLIQCNGALADIRSFHMDAEITLLTSPAFQSLMSRCPYVDEVITDGRVPLSRIRAHLALRRALRSLKFDRVYDLQNSDRTALYKMFFLRDIPWSVTTGTVPKTEPDTQRYYYQLQAAGVPVIHTLEPDVSWMAEDVSQILADANVRHPYIALIPGCSVRHQHKRWPFYPQLAEGLIAQGYDIVTVLGPEELDLAKLIPGHVLKGKTGFLSWFQLAGVLKSAHFVVGNDTGPCHLAACLGTAGLALFGSSTTPKRTGILRQHFDAIAVPDLTLLSPKDVLSATLARLNQMGRQIKSPGDA